jgi:hypothetical protein
VLTYHVVFDISERFPDAVIGLCALISAVGILALALLRRGRVFLRSTSWLWLGTSAVLWLLFNTHNMGIPSGLLLGGVGASLAFVLAFLALKDVDIHWNDEHRPRARSVASIVAPALLLLVSLEGAQQWSAFDLARQLEAGDTTVVSGHVQDAKGDSAASECFTVNSHRYCYNDDPTSIGFHRVAVNGGPIHDGLQVRVTSIGDVIVRLEIADGQ